MTKMNEIKKMKDNEIISLLTEKRELIRGFRFGTGGRDVNAKRLAKKDAARALTELQARRKGNDVSNV